MSELDSAGPEKTSPEKQHVSPARNIVGLIVLVGVLAFGWLEYTPKRGFNSAVAALEARTADEEKGLMTVPEAEAILGKEADGPAVDVKEGDYNFSKKTYTWRGLLKQYTVTAYYTTEKKEPHLHHYETEGTKFELPKAKSVTAPAGGSGRGGGGTAKGKSGASAKSSSTPAKASPDSKNEPSAPADKAATPKPDNGDKAATPKAETAKPDAGGTPAPKIDPAAPPSKTAEPKA
jgi:hypothetical protein